MNTGFIKLKRSSETLELLHHPNAFILLTVIALRARRTDEFNIHDLKAGEALIGDCKKYGLTRGQYRRAMKHLGHWGLAAFKATPRGTVATLCDTRVYDINEVAGSRPATSTLPTDDQQATTNKNEKNKKREKKWIHSDGWHLAELLLNSILARKEDFRRPDLRTWASEIDRMIRLDGRTPERIEAVIRWCQKDPFWSRNILSAAKLRKHFDRLELEMGRLPSPVPQESTRDMVERMEREGTL